MYFPKSLNRAYKDIFCERGVFYIEPYLQLGVETDSENFEVVWLSPIRLKHWQAEWRQNAEAEWSAVKIERTCKLKLPAVAVKQFIARVPRGSSGEDKYEYRILVHGWEVFSSQYKSPGNRVVVFGDFVDGSDAGLRTARRVEALDPSLTVLVGDITYEHGRMREYREHFFAAINACDANTGAQFLRKSVSAACPGNHCVGVPKSISDDMTEDDLFAFFHIWRQPANGPDLSSKFVKEMTSGHAKGDRVRKTIGPGFVGKSNFSFSWCNQHWLMLDGNGYMDWSKEKLREWVRASLKKAQSADWKFVGVHQAAFNSDRKYHVEQHIRLLFDVFQEGGVDVVFSGHCHYFERHTPLSFEPLATTPKPNGTVPGNITIDRKFDGVTNTAPKGVIQIVTGAAGQLVSKENTPTPSQYAETTVRLVPDRNSVTMLDIEGRLAIIRQIADDGEELDRISIDKRMPATTPNGD